METIKTSRIIITKSKNQGSKTLAKEQEAKPREEKPEIKNLTKNPAKEKILCLIKTIK